MNNHLIQITLKPNPAAPKLWNQLFRNTESSHENIPPSAPQYRDFYGVNPPLGISFTIQQIVPLNPSDTWVPFDVINYSVIELGNEVYNNSGNGLYPSPQMSYYSIPYKSYYTPILHPLFVDFTSSLSSKSITKDGYQKGILLRQFVVGGDNGVSSFYQFFDSPVWNVVETPIVSSIDIDLSSEQNRWDFYNMSFVIEFMFFEVEKVQLHTIDQVAYVIPPSDNVQDSLQHRFQSRFPFQQTGEHRGVYILENSGGLKKRSR